MSEVKKAIIIFHYAEKIKSNLILTANILDILSRMGEMEIVGAEKLMVAYLNALTREVHIAANASGVEGLRDVNVKLEKIIEQLELHSYISAMELVSEAISITTTNGNQTAETLKEKNLI